MVWGIAGARSGGAESGMTGCSRTILLPCGTQLDKEVSTLPPYPEGRIKCLKRGEDVGVLSVGALWTRRSGRKDRTR